jgi:hypothetical protein
MDIKLWEGYSKVRQILPKTLYIYVCMYMYVCIYCSVHKECKHEWTRNLKRVYGLVKVSVFVMAAVASDREALEKV